MGAELRALRKSLGLSQAELGKVIGTSRHWVLRAEKKTEIPEHWTLHIKHKLTLHGYLPLRK